MHRQLVERVLDCGARISVAGDIILDRYTWGSAVRVSPEAPVTVLEADLEEVRLGGAAAVAMLLARLGASVELAGVVGDDPEGRTVEKLLNDAGVGRTAVIRDSDRPTTYKQRLIGRAAGRHPHQMMRVDRETRASLAASTRTRLCDSVRTCASQSDITVLADYNKGACDEAVLQAAIEADVVMVDPALGADFEKYRGAALIKPNRREAQLVAEQAVATSEDALAVATHLQAQTDAKIVITLDQDGLVFADECGASHVPTHPREVYDVTGAGDTAMAMLALSQAAGLTLSEAGELVNLAAGIQVGRVGVSPIAPEDLLSSCALPSAATKVVDVRAAVAVRDAWRQQQQRVVFTNGCFDLLHIGHVRMLQEAAAMGDRLIVAINSDASVRELKGNDRPLIGQSDRAEMLAALGCVDHVVIFEEATPERLLRELRPDVLVKGGTTDEIVGQEIVESYGGTVGRTTIVAGISTTTLLETVKSGAED